MQPGTRSSISSTTAAARSFLKGQPLPRTIRRTIFPAASTAKSAPAVAANETEQQVWELIKQQRQQLLHRAPLQAFRLKGVTFEGRQEAVQGLFPGEPVIFLKEPSNPHDPHAVGVRAVDGQQLGYIARHLNAAFPLQACFGRVVSVGPEKVSGLWGAAVSCSPAVHGLGLDCLPSSWQGQDDLQQVFGAQQWEKLQQDVLQAYYHRCAVTAVPAASVPLQVVPNWCFDYHAKQVRLTSLMPLCEPLVLCRQHLLQQDKAGGAAEHAAALQLFAELMEWPEDQVQKYVQFVKQRQQQLELKQWQLELEQWQLVVPGDVHVSNAS